MQRILYSILMIVVASQCNAEELKQLLNVPYGKHERQVLDFYPAKSNTPTPVVFYIHGGGWQ